MDAGKKKIALASWPRRKNMMHFRYGYGGGNIIESIGLPRSLQWFAIRVRWLEKCDTTWANDQEKVYSRRLYVNENIPLLISIFSLIHHLVTFIVAFISPHSPLPLFHHAQSKHTHSDFPPFPPCECFHISHMHVDGDPSLSFRLKYTLWHFDKWQHGRWNVFIPGETFTDFHQVGTGRNSMTLFSLPIRRSIFLAIPDTTNKCPP